MRHVPICLHCHQPFDPVAEPGAVLWSPPRGELVQTCIKHHVCAPCWPTVLRKITMTP